MKTSTFSRLWTIFLFSFFFIIFFPITAQGQVVGDYRSVAMGNWNTLATWQRLNTLPNTWAIPTTGQGYPGQNSSTANVTFQTGFDVTLNVSPTNSIATLTTQGTGRLINSATNGITLTISGNIILGPGPSLNSDPINMKVSSNDNTIILNGTSQQTISNSSSSPTAYFYNLTISNTSAAGVILNNKVFILGNLNVSTNCTYDISTYESNKKSSLTSIFTLQSGSKLRLAGTTGGATGSNFPIWISDAGTLSYSIDPTSTIEYDGDGSTTQTISSSYATGSTPLNITYGNLLLSNGNATGTANKNLTNNIAGIAGNLTVGDKVSFDLSTFTANRSANTVNFSLNGSAALKLAANNFPSGYSTNTISNNSTIEYNGTIAQTILAMNYGNLISSNSGPRTLASSGTIGVYGAFTPGTNVYTVSGSTVDFNGSTSQTISAFTFNNLIINNNAGVTLSSDVTANTSLLINSGKILTIPLTRQLNVLGTITNNAGVSGLIIKSDPDNLLANGSLIFHNAAGSPVQATVEMYSKASKATNYKWQFFGIPLRTMLPSPTFDGSYVRQMYETGTTTTEHWLQLTNASTLTSFTGYEITQVTPKTLYFQGNLENGDYTSGQLSFTSGATYPGQHLIGNPYTAAIDISKIIFGSQMLKTVYLYNTGSSADWAGHSIDSSNTSNNNNTPGQYIAVPQANAGDAGLQHQIPSMQAFLVRAKIYDPAATVSIPYSSANTVVKNINLQRARASEKICTIINVKGQRYGDCMWIFSDPYCSHNFDNGWDGEKFFGSALAPQIFAMEADGNYQVNSVNDMNNTDIGFWAGVDTNYTLTFTNQNFSLQYSNLYLRDLQENTITDITQSGTIYSFTALPTDSPVKRFNILTRSKNTDTSFESPNAENKQLKIFNSQDNIFVHNSSNMSGNLKLYDISGRCIQNKPFIANGVTTIPMNLPAGIYIAMGTTANQEVTERLLIR